tara:strand:- start:540 stop:944 length:405 start_codon:yes stop_codon:yes gene_type:complete
MQMFDQAIKFEDVDTDTLCIEHFDDMQQELGMSTVWSMWDGGTMDADQAIFTDKMRKVTYNFVRADATLEEIYADLDDNGNRSMVQVSSFAVNGTVKALWAAAESCIKQSGTHHSFIEDFEMQDDGSLALVTGS